MPNELVEIARFETPEEANVARCALEADEIQTFADGEAAAGWLWYIGSAIGGVKLLVKRDDALRAREVLASRFDFSAVDDDWQEEEAYGATDEEVEKGDKEEPLGSPQPREVIHAWRAALIGLVFLPVLLNFYSMWLLFRYYVLEEDESHPLRWRALAALAVNLVVFTFWGILFYQVANPPEIPKLPGEMIEERVSIPLLPPDVPRREYVDSHRAESRGPQPMTETDNDHITAHKHSIRNHDELLRSEQCGCFYCREVYAPAEIMEWVRDGETPSEQTALCPRCGIDSVIGSASRFPITREFLERMNRHWF